MAAFYGYQDFPKTMTDKKDPDELQKSEGGAEVNKSYAMSDDEDDEDGEGAGAAANAGGEAAAAATAAPDAASAAAKAAQA
jgi:hypothetical protein